jgi:hypothetical protein
LYVRPNNTKQLGNILTGTPQLQLNFVGRPLYQLAVCNYKVCACLGYRRLFERTNGVRYMGWIATFVNYFIFVIIISHFATTLVIIFQCRPVEKSWRPWIEGRCLANYPAWNVRKKSRHLRFPALILTRLQHRSPLCATSLHSSSQYRYPSDYRWIPATRST